MIVTLTVLLVASVVVAGWFADAWRIASQRLEVTVAENAWLSAEYGKFRNESISLHREVEALRAELERTRSARCPARVGGERCGLVAGHGGSCR